LPAEAYHWPRILNIAKTTYQYLLLSGVKRVIALDIEIFLLLVHMSFLEYVKNNDVTYDGCLST